MPELVLVGHSHVDCFGGSKGIGPDDYTPNPIDPDRGFFRLGGNPSTAGYWEAAIRLSRTRPLAVCWMGNQHNLHFMFVKQPFDFCLCARPDLAVDSAVPLVAELEIREVFRADIQMLEHILQRMLDSKGPRPVVLGTPPPRGDNDAIRAAMLASREFYAQVAARSGLYDLATAPLAPVRLRYKLWCLLQVMMEEVATRLGLKYWPVSDSATTEDGFLRREFWGEDTTHANAAYGSLMLDEYELRRAVVPA